MSAENLPNIQTLLVDAQGEPLGTNTNFTRKQIQITTIFKIPISVRISSFHLFKEDV